jgi:hypothetical protein
MNKKTNKAKQGTATASGNNAKEKENLQKQKNKEEAGVLMNKLDEYLNNNGLSFAFNLIFSEIVDKKIPSESHFEYTMMRLRQLGKEIEDCYIKNK